MVVLKRILVTGGAGFIGSLLCEDLISNGQEILCVDNYFSGRRKKLRNTIGSFVTSNDQIKDFERITYENFECIVCISILLFLYCRS